MDRVRPSSLDRKAAIRAYKERPTERGVFSFRCVPTGELWVGGSRDLYASRNSLPFTLRLGRHRERTLQAAWNRHDESAFRFEVLQVLDEDTPALVLPEELKRASGEWATKLGARALP
ncbi:MAG TPA: GIY-YIG nuclease family protein [Vicinamibacterales bacterium]|jgi:hypothetical protein|nr:GIY-YIG nuclease family protein [Vicinamibacterales bacterium]HVZ20362.1 GIY-YIG nuclease family protein [Vicinamibacterales bacterium]